MNDSNFEIRQLRLIKILIRELRKTKNINCINDSLGKIYTLISFFEKYNEWHQKLLENWGTLEIINALMLAENRCSFSAEEEKQRFIALNNLESLLNQAPLKF